MNQYKEHYPDKEHYPEFEEQSGFFMKIRLEFKRILDFSKPSGLLVALSGGVDSMFLLVFLIWLRKREGFPLLAAHFNHHLRPEADEEESRFLHDFCQEWEVPYIEGGAVVKELSNERKQGVEEAARAARYDFFDAALSHCEEEFKLPFYLCLGQHLDDQAETVLHNLGRGTGLTGLCGMPAKVGKKLRPLLSVRRAEIENFMQERDLPWREDLSNQSLDYRRNRIRHLIIPQWKEVLGDDLPAKLAGMASHLQAEEEVLRELSSKHYAEIRLANSELNLRKMSELPLALQRRVLLQWLEDEGLDAPHRDTMEEFLRLLSDLPREGRLPLSKGHELYLNGYILCIQSDGQKEG